MVSLHGAFRWVTRSPCFYVRTSVWPVDTSVWENTKYERERKSTLVHFKMFLVFASACIAKHGGGAGPQGNWIYRIC